LGLTSTGSSTARGRMIRWVAIAAILIVLGMALLDMMDIRGLRGFDATRLQERAARGGWGWAVALGVLFALSFCPASAGLFFAVFLPIAATQNSVLLLPALYGIGTALPVVGFSVVMAYAAGSIGRAMNCLTTVERWVRMAAGVAFIAAGVYLTLTTIYGVRGF